MSPRPRDRIGVVVDGFIWIVVAGLVLLSASCSKQFLHISWLLRKLNLEVVVPSRQSSLLQSFLLQS